MKEYRFPKPLKQGIILSRPNRFVMMVSIDGRIVRCFCPCPTRIGSLKFKNIPCLLSKNSNSYTVEAISLNPSRHKMKNWIGINQTKINAYVEYFLRSMQLNKIAGKIKNMRREYPLGKSRVDFLINSMLLEVKTPLTILPRRPKLKYAYFNEFNSYHRTVKHYQALANSIGKFKKAIVLHCFMYDADIYRGILSNINNQKMQNVVINATQKGIENWQVNLKIDSKGIKLRKYFKLRNNIFLQQH